MSATLVQNPVGAGDVESMASTLGILHVHSTYSHDGRSSLEEIHAAAATHGLRFVALTDHAEDFDASLFEEYQAHAAAVSEDVRLITGLEFRFRGYRGLHLLAIGLQSWIDPRTPEEFIKLAPAAGAFTVVAHPVLARYRIPRVVADGIDAVEVWNARYDNRWLPDARSVAALDEIRSARPWVVGTVGMDMHDARERRLLRVAIGPAEHDPVAAIRGGRFTNVSAPLRFDPAVSWTPHQRAIFRVAHAACSSVERAQVRVARELSGGQRSRLW